MVFRENVASRASAGAACWRASERDEQGVRGACCPPPPCFVLGWCRMGAAARRAWGVSVVQTRGVFGSLGGERRGGGLWGAPSGGHRTGFLLFSLLGGTTDPPWCSTDPASPTAALQKGLCWGVCRLYPGLRGCVRRGREGERG